MKKQNSMMKKVSWFLVTVLIFTMFVVPVGSLASVESTPEDVLNAHLTVTWEM